MESNYAAENISTEQPPACKEARLQGENGDQERQCSTETPQSKGPQTPDGQALLGFSLPKEARLRKRAEFQRVYEHGKRIEGRFMTVFILPSKRGVSRVGVTATKKAIGKAHDRNRAKRLLRESFRLNRAEIETIEVKCDWVLNARRSLLHAKVDKPLSELKGIVQQIRARHSEHLPQGSQPKTGD